MQYLIFVYLCYNVNIVHYRHTVLYCKCPKVNHLTHAYTHKTQKNEN